MPGLEASTTVEKAEETVTVLEQCPSSIDEKALVRKLDFKILPMLFIIYLASFLDRVSISNALTLGLPKDLKLVGNETNVALTIFFVPYVLFEIPSNFFLKHYKPHVWLSCCILAFGIVILAQGFVQSYSGLLATRFFLGFAEAGVFPGSFYLISFWYKREEAQRRFTVYWCSILIASAFGGLLASAISKMQGIRGYSSWRWIFILEGIFTILVGIVAFFLVSDFPEEAKWLTEEERKWVIARTLQDKEAPAKITVKDILRFFSVPRNILGGIMFFSTAVPIYSFAYFAPTIIKTLGYSTVQTQLHTVPPIAAALALALLLAYTSDLTRLRFPYILLCLSITFTGLAILISISHHFSVQYLGLHFVAMGAFAGGPIIVCWYVMNLRGHVERSIGTAWMIGFGNTGGIVATFSFLAHDSPRYVKGYAICLATIAVGFLSVAAYGLLIIRENRRLSADSSAVVRAEQRYKSL